MEAGCGHREEMGVGTECGKEADYWGDVDGGHVPVDGGVSKEAEMEWIGVHGLSVAFLMGEG